MQSNYQLEIFEGEKKQISRFSEDGNRIVVIKVDSFDDVRELDFIVAALNYALDTIQRDYKSADPYHETR